MSDLIRLQLWLRRNKKTDPSRTFSNVNATAGISLDYVIVDLCDTALVHMNATTFVAGNDVVMNNGLRGTREVNAVYPANYQKAGDCE